MSSASFDWKGLIASDPRYAAEDEVGERVAAGAPGDEWKTDVLGAYFRDDQLMESSRKAETWVGVLPAVVGAVKVLGQTLFGKKVVGGDLSVSDITIGPEECAMVIRDGKVLGTFTQARVEHGTSFLAWLKALVGTAPNYRLLMVDAAPFDIRLVFGSDGGPTTLMTKDDQLLQGYLTARMQFDVEHLENVLGLMRGRTLLHQTVVSSQIQEVVFARVLVPLAREHLAQDIRANIPLQDKIRGEAQRSIEGLYRDVGLLLRNMTVSWSLTEEELADLDERRKQAAAVAAARAAERQKAGLQREHDVAVLERELQANAQQIAIKQALLHEAEVAQLESTTEIDKAKAQVELTKIRLEVEKLEAEQGILIRQKSEAVEREHLEEMRRIQREDVLATEEARAKAGTDAEVAKVEAYGKLTPEQILAVQSASTPEAARALTEKFKAEAAVASSQAAALEEATRRHGEVAHEMAKAYGDQMASVARAGAGSKTDEPSLHCGQCGTSIAKGWKACPSCGATLGKAT